VCAALRRRGAGRCWARCSPGRRPARLNTLKQHQPPRVADGGHWETAERARCCSPSRRAGAGEPLRDRDPLRRQPDPDARADGVVPGPPSTSSRASTRRSRRSSTLPRMVGTGMAMIAMALAGALLPVAPRHAAHASAARLRADDLRRLGRDARRLVL
jgi:hypothetical protein